MFRQVQFDLNSRSRHIGNTDRLELSAPIVKANSVEWKINYPHDIDDGLRLITKLRLEINDDLQFTWKVMTKNGVRESKGSPLKLWQLVEDHLEKEKEDARKQLGYALNPFGRPQGNSRSFSFDELIQHANQTTEKWRSSKSILEHQEDLATRFDQTEAAWISSTNNLAKASKSKNAFRSLITSLKNTKMPVDITLEDERRVRGHVLLLPD